MRTPIHNPGRLFRRRMLSHWKYQISVMKSMVDWTVMLYILIPFLFIGGGLYMELWTSPLPAWLPWIPPQIAAVLLLYMFSGNTLLFVEEGDVLFLRQHPDWMKGLMVRGISYSLIITGLKGMLFFLIVLPFLYRGFELDAGTLTVWVMLASAAAWCTNLIVHRIRVSCSGLKQWIYSMILRVASFSFYLLLVEWLQNIPVVSFIAVWLLLIVVILFLIQRKISMKGSFMADVREDARTRMWFTSKLLVQAVGQVPRVKSKTWIFRKSGRIYRSSSPDKRFAEAGVKAFLRSSENLLLYAQFSVVSIPAVLFPPAVVKIIIFPALMFLMAYLLYLRWNAFAEDEFSLVLPFTGVQQKAAGTLVVRTLMIPPAFVISLVLGLSLWPGLIGVLAAVPLTMLCAIVIPAFFSFPVVKRKYD